MQAFVDPDGPKSDTDELDLIDDLQELDWECAIEEEMNRNDRKFAANFGYEMQQLDDYDDDSSEDAKRED